MVCMTSVPTDLSSTCFCFSK